MMKTFTLTEDEIRSLVLKHIHNEGFCSVNATVKIYRIPHDDKAKRELINTFFEIEVDVCEEHNDACAWNNKKNDQ